MSEIEQKREIRRMLRLLRQMTELAEHVEQTGSFESGAHNSVKRYNAIVEHLEEHGAIPEEMFPGLEEDSGFGQLGAEATLLANYLQDLVDEEDNPTPKRGTDPKQDFGWLLGMAPFLEKTELTNLVRAHFAGKPAPPAEPTPASEKTSSPLEPDLAMLVEVAPHVDSKTLGEMVRTCLSRHQLTDPKQLLSLAPHMESGQFSQLLREYLPAWFGASSAAQPNEAQTASEWEGSGDRSHPTPSSTALQIDGGRRQE